MILGIDLGGTNLCMGLVDNGIVVRTISVPSFSPSSCVEETLEYMSGHISSVMSSDIRRIGIGVPSVVDINQGIVYNAANIPSWEEVHLKEFLEDRFRIPVSLITAALSAAPIAVQENWGIFRIKTVVWRITAAGSSLTVME